MPIGKSDFVRNRILETVLAIPQDVPTVTFNTDPPREVGAEWEIHGDSREPLAPGWQLVNAHGAVILLILQIEFRPEFLPSNDAQARRLQEGHRMFRARVRRIPEELPELPDPPAPRRTAWEWISSDDDSV